MADTFQPSSLVYTPPRHPSQNLRTLLAYVDARNHLAPDIMKFFHATLEHRYLPKSLGRPVLNRRQYGEYVSQLQPMFASFRVRETPQCSLSQKRSHLWFVSYVLCPRFDCSQMTLHQVIETGDTIVYHVRYPSVPAVFMLINFGQATAVGESVCGVPYDNEYMSTVQFVVGDYGPQICYVKEYVDSKKTTEFFKEHRARVAENNRRRSQLVSQGS